MSDVQGTVEPGFESVREVFEGIAADEARDGGAQLVVHHRGRPVVDLWGGDGVDGDSLLALYSSAKGVTALVTALLVQDGALDLDRTVASWWPEYAAEGKGALTLRGLLAHRSGSIGVEGGFTFDEIIDDRVVAARLAAHRPYWEPDSGHGYHGLTFGALVGEVVLRATGRTVQEHYEERLRVPYGLDYHLGLPEELEARFAPALPLVPTPEQQEALDAEPVVPGSRMSVAFGLESDPPLDLVAYGNARAAHVKAPLSAGGVGTARGLSRLYAAVAGPFEGRPPLLTDETLAEFSRVHSKGTDLVTGGENAFGLGLSLLSTGYPSLSPRVIGHSGAPGTQSFADPATGLAYSYARRRFAFMGGPGAPENVPLIEAVVAAVRARG
ncbi:serine hydrolase domain-containing protein [Streptomyces termitum]|uniref:Serine hydrolase n=1 Tax=Streptomyces termitum TaxID=67368 RepID=A0A918SWD5_9ACTN|nr:serine hydrolase domain-containing protein [Streptomyces termitum]GHA74936.1 serine hydrolase [Streptomyces termitum]